MRYYLYISDAKVDMLLPQVPGAIQRKVSTKLGVDFKAVSASYSVENTTLDNRIARLSIVEEFIRSQQPVGEQGDLTSWIAGEANAKLVDLGQGAILFIINTKLKFLALGGSAKHLIGAQSAETPQIPYSSLHGLTHHLTKMSEDRAQSLIKLPESYFKGGNMAEPWENLDFGHWISVMEWLEEYDRGILQPITFLSKRLVSEEYFGKIYTLASPLFVAIDD